MDKNPTLQSKETKPNKFKNRAKKKLKLKKNSLAFNPNKSFKPKYKQIKLKSEIKSFVPTEPSLTQSSIPLGQFKGNSDNPTISEKNIVQQDMTSSHVFPKKNMLKDRIAKKKQKNQSRKNSEMVKEKDSVPITEKTSQSNKKSQWDDGSKGLNLKTVEDSPKKTYNPKSTFYQKNKFPYKKKPRYKPAGQSNGGFNNQGFKGFPQGPMMNGQFNPMMGQGGYNNMMYGMQGFNMNRNMMGYSMGYKPMNYGNGMKNPMLNSNMSANANKFQNYNYSKNFGVNYETKNVQENKNKFVTSNAKTGAKLPKFESKSEIKKPSMKERFKMKMMRLKSSQ